MISLARHLDQLPLYGACGLCICVLLIQTVTPLDGVRSRLESSAFPLVRLQQALANVMGAPSAWWDYVRSNEEHRRALEAEVTLLRSQVAVLSAAGEELKQLKHDIHSSPEQSPQDFQHTARLLLGDPWALDVGEDDGVRIGDAVFAHGVFVGLVKDTTPRFSTLDHIPRGSLRVVARTSANASGVVMNEGGEVWLEYVSADAKLDVGDVVYTAGSAALAIPPQLYLGTVVSVLRDDQAATLRARIDQGISLQTLRSVRVEGWRERETTD